MAFAASKSNNIFIGYVQVAFLDSDNYPVGANTSPDTKVADTVYGAYLLDGIIDLVPATPTIPRVNNLGGQRMLSITRVPAQDYGTPLFQLSQVDETFESYIMNKAIDVTSNTARARMGGNLAQDVWKRFIIVFSILVKNTDTGANEWRNYTYTNVNILKTQDAGAAQITGDVTNPNPLQYSVDISLSDRDSTGELLSSNTALGVGSVDGLIIERTSKPLGIATYIADGVETTFTLPYLPTSDTATGEGENTFTLNGTITAVSSVATTTGLVTLSAAGSSGDVWVTTYETDFVPSS